LLYNSRYHSSTGWLCGDPTIIGSLKEAEKCIESCEIYDGECKNSPPDDEDIEIQGVNCEKDQKCYISKGTQNLVTNDLKINKFFMSYALSEDINLLEIEEFEFSKLKIAGDISVDGSGRGGRDIGSIDINLISPEINFEFEIDTSKSYCYFLRTEKEILHSGYSSTNLKIETKNKPWDDENKDNTILFFAFRPSDKRGVYKTIFNKKEVTLQFYRIQQY
jgi:hypothetical protein